MAANSTGVYQKDNGYWEYRFVMMVDGKQKPVLQIFEVDICGGRGTILLPNQLYIVEKKSRLGDTIPFLCLQSEFVKNTNSVSVGTRGSFPQSWFGD